MIQPRILCSLGLLLWPALTFAAPWSESRSGGLALIGPALDHPASVFYNPAALSLLPGHHIFLDSTVRLATGSAGLYPADPASGRPTPGGTPQPRADLREVFPQLFLALSSDLATESVVLSLALHTPYTQRASLLAAQSAQGPLFDPAAQGPARSHLVDLTTFHLFVTPAVSLRLADAFRFGVSISYVFGLVDLAFVRDAALEGGRAREAGEYVALDDCANGGCGYGADAAAEAVRVRGTANGIGFSVGVLGRPHRNVDVGAAYVSRVLGIGGDNIPAKGAAWVRRSQAVLENARRDPSLVGEVGRDLEGRGTISYSLPDMVNAGVAWRTTPRLLLALDLRWLNYSVHDLLDVRLTGTQFRATPQIPDRLVHYRGFQDVFGVQIGAAYALTKRLVLQGASLLETSALPTEAVSPAAVDALKVDTFLAVRVALASRVTLRAGYGLVLMPTVRVSDSAFSPSEMVACVDSHFDVDLPECRRASAGRGLASAAGEYRLITHRLGMSLSYDVW